jgi:hypothetical protein
MLRFVNMLELLLVLVLVEGCGGVSENDDEDSSDNGDNGGTVPPPETGPFPPLDAVVEVSNAFADVMGDVFFACPSVAIADVLAGARREAAGCRGICGPWSPDARAVRRGHGASSIRPRLFLGGGAKILAALRRV